MIPDFPAWPYVPTLARLSLAMAIGLLIGIERERRDKVAGIRTFAFASLLGAVGGLLGQAFALLALALLGVMVVLLNVETIRAGEGTEMTTSVALLVTAFAGVLAGLGHTFTPTVLGIATAALLAWKQPLSGFSRALTESELRSAILLAILAFVIYPVLPQGSIDPSCTARERDGRRRESRRHGDAAASRRGRGRHPRLADERARAPAHRGANDAGLGLHPPARLGADRRRPAGGHRDPGTALRAHPLAVRASGPAGRDACTGRRLELLGAPRPLRARE
jgi:MgtC family